MLLTGGAMFAMWFFLTLYMQDVLHFSPLITGLGFLPQTAAIAIGAQVASRLVTRVGPRLPLITGAVLSAVGLAWLSRVGAGGSYWGSVFGGADVATLGMGLAITPLAFAATAGVMPQEAGLASGVLNTSRQVGASVALAVLATLAADRTTAILTADRAAGLATRGAAGAAHQASALASGFSRGLLAGAILAAAGAAVALAIPRQPHRAPAPAEGEARVASVEGDGHVAPAAPALALEPED